MNSGKPIKNFWSDQLSRRLGKDSPSEFSLALGVVVTTLCFLPIASVILGMETNLDIEVFVQSTILDMSDFRPEPQEQLLYIAGLVYFPLALFAWHFAAQRLALPGDAASVRRAITWFLLIPGFWLLLPVTAFLSTPGTWNKSAYAVLGMTEFGLPTWLNLIAALCILAAVFRLQSRILVDVVCIGLTLLLAVMTLFGENDAQALSLHLQVLVSPLLQVMHGETLLVDLTSQYGLFPQMLAPVFNLAGMSIESITFVMSGLSLTSMLLLYVAMRRLVSSAFILLLGYSAMLAFACYWNRFMGLNEAGLDPYFQYWPIRTLFPALAIFMIVQHDNHPTRGTLVLGHVILSVGCLWNLDSGVPAWGAWVAYVLYRAGDGRRFFLEGLLALGVLLLVVAGCSFYLYLRAGTFPSMLQLIEPHRVFAYAGHHMLPAVMFHPWNLVVIGYISALGWSIRRWHDRRFVKASVEESEGAVVFSIAVLGSGLLSYYIGRSHDLVFPLTSYPAFILAVIFLDRLVMNRESTGVLARSMGLFIAGVCLLLVVGLVGKVVVLSDVALQRLALMSSPRIERTSQVLGLVEGHRMGHESIIFLSDQATYWHVLTGTSAGAPDNLNVMFYKTEVDELAAAIAAGEIPVFVDTYFSLPGKGKIYQVHQQLLAVLRDAGYQAHVYTEDGTFSYWARSD